MLTSLVCRNASRNRVLGPATPAPILDFAKHPSPARAFGARYSRRAWERGRGEGLRRPAPRVKKHTPVRPGDGKPGKAETTTRAQKPTRVRSIRAASCCTSRGGTPENE